jgi:chromosome partitioning protein
VRFRYQVREDASGFSYFCSQICQQRSLVGDVERGARVASVPHASPGHAASTSPVAPRPQSARPGSSRPSVVVPKPAATVSSAEPEAASDEPAANSAGCACDVCGKRFQFEYPFQVSVSDRGASYYCTMACRNAARAGVSSITRAGAKVNSGPRRIAVFNHKGGTGKTTTAVNLAAGLAEAGNRVLLIDADGQGNVGASLGIRGEHTLYHVLVQGIPADRAAVPVRQNLDVLTSNEMLAAAELHLATRPNRDRILRERLGDRVSGYDVVVIDCAPALSLMNQNALVYADSVLVPVSCDYLSLVGVKQVLRTLKNVRELLKHDVSILGVLPTFYDARAKIARDSIEALRDHFGDRCLPAVRASTKLREAPSVRKTIFEHAPDSHGAEDYRALVEHVRRVRGDAGLIDRESASSSAVGLRAEADVLSASTSVAAEAAMAV